MFPSLKIKKFNTSILTSRIYETVKQFKIYDPLGGAILPLRTISGTKLVKYHDFYQGHIMSLFVLFIQALYFVKLKYNLHYFAKGQVNIRGVTLNWFRKKLYEHLYLVSQSV